MVPEEALVGVFGPRVMADGTGLTDGDIKERFRNPIGSPPIREIARGARRVLIVADDNTRPTPVKRLAPFLLEELEAAGVPGEGISFLIGLGTHRIMTREEVVEKLGAELIGRYRIHNHAWDNPGDLVSIGKCKLGFDVVINRHAVESDLIIALGNIIPHATTGFSGGGKAIMPGISGEKSIEATHWKALDFPMSEILGVFDNPVREAAVSVARKVGLKAIVNTVLFNGSSIYDLVVGDVEAAHRYGARRCCEVYGVEVPDAADIVIAEAYPTDIDLRQAIKAICSADLICRDGGVIILPAECPEGAAPQFPDFERYGFRNPEVLYKDVEEGRFSQKLMAYTLVAVGRIISKRVRAILVSPHISERKALDMGFMWAQDLQHAVDKAFLLAGKYARIAVLKQAGELLPIISQK